MLTQFLLQGGETSEVPLSCITINGITLDQSTKPATDAFNTNYILVQSKARLSPSQRRELADIGLVLHDYVSKNTYLYGYQGVDLDRIRQMEPVAYVDVYRLEFKIPPSLGKAVPDSPHKVDVVFHEDVDTGSTKLRDLIALKSRLSAGHIEFFPHKARLTIQAGYLNDVASIDEVRRIGEVGKVVPRNNQARLILGADIQPALIPAQEQAYTGKGQVIAIADTGLDRGQMLAVHPAFGDRVLELYPMGGHAADSDGHGTHVCGSAVGDYLTHDNDRIMGTAPQAHLVVQCAGSNFDRLPGDLSQLFELPYDQHGVRVHSNSWGGEMIHEQLDYDQNGSAEEIDRFVWTHQEMVICFAAGNDAKDLLGTGDVGQEHIGAEAAAKNCITVGACENNRPNVTDTYGDIWPRHFPHFTIGDRLEAEDGSRVAAFSSRGLTKEGRSKPDVVAPGTCILSANSRHVGDPDRPGPDQLWCYMSGTSMATPLVAGCAAVLREALIKNGTHRPSAALIKALLINGAEILSQPMPNIDSGFGRVNLGNSIAIALNNKGTAFHEGRFAQSNENAFSVEIAAEPEHTTLKATLVWSDPPGRMTINNLLLQVHADGAHGVQGYLDDHEDEENLNNVQQVLWKNIPQGNITITVKSSDIQVFPQPFALIWRLY